MISFQRVCTVNNKYVYCKIYNFELCLNLQCTTDVQSAANVQFIVVFKPNFVFVFLFHPPIYRKVASSDTSRLEAHADFFRLLMKGILYFDKKLISWLVMHVRTRDYTVNTSECIKRKSVILAVFKKGLGGCGLFYLLLNITFQKFCFGFLIHI